MLSHTPPQDKNRWFKRSHTTWSSIRSRWRLPIDFLVPRMDFRSVYIYNLFCKSSLCNKHSDYIVTFISIHSVFIYIVFFGACMRRTRLCPLNPGVTSRALHLIIISTLISGAEVRTLRVVWAGVPVGLTLKLSFIVRQFPSFGFKANCLVQQCWVYASSPKVL
jgi:hypothetical protein